MRKRKINKRLHVALVLVLMISLFTHMKLDASALDNDVNNSVASSMLNENAIFTSIDENGNTYILDEEESGIVEVSPKLYTMRAIVPQQDILIERGVVNFRTKSSSSNTEYEDAATGLAGYTNGTYAADAAYLGHSADRSKVKFMLAGVIGWVDADDVQVLDFSDSAVNTLSKYYVKNGRLYHGIVTNLNNSKYSSNLDCGPKPSYLEDGKEYYSYDGHYFYAYDGTNGYIKMLKDYRNDTRQNSVNPTNPYYNYYQYLPQRTKTIYTAEELDSIITTKAKAYSSSIMLEDGKSYLGATFIENQDKYGVNALLTLGIAANESAWGSSNIALQKNNLFGHNAYDSDPNGNSNAYSTPKFSIYYHTSTFMSEQYCYPKNWKYHGAYLGDKASGVCIKYASDPYWGEKNASFAWYVDKTLGSRDSFRYTLAIKDVNNYDYNKVSIMSGAKSNSKTLYSTVNTDSDILTGYTMVVLDDEPTNNYYKIQSDAIISSDRTSIVKQKEYSFTSNYAYVHKDHLTIVKNGTVLNPESTGNTPPENPGTTPDKPVEPETPVIPEKTHEEVLAATKLKHADGYLTGFTLGENISETIKLITDLDDRIIVNVKDKDGKTVTSGIVTTGMTITAKTKGTEKIYTTVLYGDVNGDGNISPADYVKVKNKILGKELLNDSFLVAGDVTKDNNISPSDYVKIKNNILGKETIVQ